MGESAGGNLAACASLMWRDRQPRGVTVAHQVLLSPCIPTRPLMPSRTDPARANGALLPAWLMEYFEIAYAGSSSVHGADTIVEELAEQPYFNPLAAQSLAGLPPITGVVGGAEVLRDEGVAYFEAAEKAGVDVAFREYEDGYHAFIIFPFGQSAAAWSFVRGRLRGSRVLELRGGAAASIGRRRVLSRVAVTALARPHRAQAVAFKDTLEEGLPGEALLGESSIYAVRVDSSSRALPSASRQSARRLVRTMGSQRAIFLGEHHPEPRDHQLQAALLTALLRRTTRRPLAVGLEAVQQRFQPALDDYLAGRLDEAGLVAATEWERRWYWSFAAYAPIFRICRTHGVTMLALDMDSEDKAKVELGGALEPAKRRQYVPDGDGFERFGSTRAFEEYVSYTLRPPFTLMRKAGQRMTASTDDARTMSFPNFLTRQSLRDEAMASASAAWLAEHPQGLLLGLVGVNHVKFSCGVPARTARMLPGGLDAVASVLLNPTAASTFVDPFNLRLCDRAAVANEACLRNDIEVQNYVLQVPFAQRGAMASRGVMGRDPVEEARSAMQARRGSSVLALSDYLIFSR